MSPTAADPHRDPRVVHFGAPIGEGRGVVILVHGRNASPENIIGLADDFSLPDLTYLAPAAANNTWYPFSFMSDRASNEPYLTSALDTLERLVDDLATRGIPAAKVALLGFSQGACLTGEFAVRQATRYAGIIMYSGGLIGPPGTNWDSPGTFAGTPVFLGCSDIDAHIPRLASMRARTSSRAWAPRSPNASIPAWDTGERGRDCGRAKILAAIG